MGKYLVYLLPLSIKAVQEILDAVVDGKDLKDHEVRALQSGFCELTIWGKHLASETKGNTYDDDAVNAILASIAKMLNEAETQVPVL